MALTFGMFWALLTLGAARGAGWAWWMLAATLFLRFAVALAVGRLALRDRQVIRWLVLIPLRDAVALVVWVVSFAGHTVNWHGSSFVLKDGKLARMPR